MRCFSCGTELTVDAMAVPFGATCENCAAWLHCCKGCRFYNPRVAQSCEQPTADYVGEKEHRNLCELFKAIDPARATPAKVDTETARKRFEDLFR